MAKKKTAKPSEKDVSIPEMNIDHKYSPKKAAVTQQMSDAKKANDTTKAELEKFRGEIVKKYPFTLAMGLLAPQTIPFFIKEEEVPKETEQFLHLYIVIPEDKYKESKKILQEIIPLAEAAQKTLKQKLWVQIKTPIDIFETCLDSKFELSSAIATAYPLYDTGFLGALRVAEIHKSLVLQKFERYVVSYVMGGSLVRGEAKETSDVDVFVIINDTDVKRMPRMELKERLRSIIYQYINEATAIAGVKNRLEPQIYLLTDFWESVKDAHPVMFTFIRDGIPLYDRGTFMPWKALLKMGKLRPSPEALDMFLSTGDRTIKRAKRALLDILVHDLYWGVLTPSQGILMLDGRAPPTPKQTIVEMNEAFVKTKMLEKKYLTTLEKVVDMFKDYEHEKLKEVSGSELDKLIKASEEYLARLGELRKDIEAKANARTIEEIVSETQRLLKKVTGKTAQKDMTASFERMVQEGLFTKRHVHVLKAVLSSQKADQEKRDTKETHALRRDGTTLMNDLIDYLQRKELVPQERNQMQVEIVQKGKKHRVNLIHCDGQSFLVQGNTIKKITSTVVDSNVKELDSALQEQKKRKHVSLNPNVFSALKAAYGDYNLIY